MASLYAADIPWLHAWLSHSSVALRQAMAQVMGYASTALPTEEAVSLVTVLMKQASTGGAKVRPASKHQRANMQQQH